MQRYLKFSDCSLAATMRLFAYYLQRLIVSRRLRRFGTYVICQALRYAHVVGHRTNRPSDRADTFRMVGYLSLGRCLGEEQCRDIHNYLHDKSVHDNRGTGGVYNLSIMPAETKLGDYSLDTVVHCPHVMELANQSDFLSLATEYLGFTPTITNLSLRWSFPTDSPADDVQSFHRDTELGSFKILVYLTDVDLESGPHVYVAGSHHDRMPLRIRLYSDEEIERDYGSSIIVTGIAGTAFAIDTKGIHKGVPPITRRRLVLGIQYSLLPSLLYGYAPVRQSTRTKFDKYVNRLIVRTEDAIEI